MTGSYESTETHLLLHGPGVFELGQPWNELVEVEDGKTRQRKLPDNGRIWDAPVFAEPEPEPRTDLPPIRIERRMFIGLKKVELPITPEVE